MDYIQNRFNISKLTLGTVQLGLDYSINSRKPDFEESKAILKEATEQGITTLDTAREYGNSEEIIGSFLKEHSGPVVVSKFKVSPENLADPQVAYKEAYESVKASIEVLKIDKIPILLFHKGPMHRISDTCKVIPEILERLKEQGLIEMGGVSVFEPEEISELSSFDEVEAFQVPVNIFDHRLMNCKVLDTLNLSGKVVFARSIFLKGLFFKNPNSLKGKLDAAIPYLESLHRMAMQANLSIAELAFLYVRDIPGITSTVVGADNIQQVKQNIELLNKPGLGSDLREEVQNAFSSVPKQVVTPHLWRF